MESITSSYNTDKLSFYHMFQTLVASVNPKRVVEFGILNGFSLKAFSEFCDSKCAIDAYDIFEKFEGNGAKKSVIEDMFRECNNVKIGELDFYEGFKKYDNGSIDILHVDIANNGDVYKFTIDNYLDKISAGGVIVFEGGSVERDGVAWMKKYEKPSIATYLNKLREKRGDELIVSVIDVFPSMTIVRRRRGRS